MERSIILNTAYFAPIQYFSKLLAYPKSYIEQYDHYEKQTFRNRCIILSGNGPISLTIPVTKTNGNKTWVKDIRIFNDEPWQMNHVRALKAAYQNSPFYEFYIDALQPVWEKKWDFLIDLNIHTSQLIAEEMETQFPMELSTTYMSPTKFIVDFRDKIHPKKNMLYKDESFTPPIYHQVFLDRFPFHPNLSILDLLFNKGPEALQYLSQCIKNTP